MNREWQNAVLNQVNPHFASYAHQRDAIENGSVISLLSTFSLLQVTGEDVAHFLQGQLSNDIAMLTQNNSQYSCYSSAKGRMLASFLIWQRDNTYYLLASRDIATAICKRLSMYVLRAKVKIALCHDFLLFGLNGPLAQQGLKKKGVCPSQPFEQCALREGACIKLSHGGWLLALPQSLLTEWLADLPKELIPLTQEAWSLLDITAGIAWITAATQELFVPQMANMDLIGAISFKKGCYTGQEVIARTHYLGKIKRRLFRVQLATQAQIGAKLYCPALENQTIGHIVNLARDKNDNSQALAVVQSRCWADGVYLEGEKNLPLEKLDLPYTVENE